MTTLLALEELVIACGFPQDTSSGPVDIRF